MIAEFVTVANPNPAGQKVAVFAIMFFVFFYGLFIDAASFIYSSEIYPTNIRSRGMALSTTTYFVACIVSFRCSIDALKLPDLFDRRTSHPGRPP